MPYIGRSLGDGVRARYIYAATSGQTTFSGNDANGIALAYSDTLYMDVYQNGVLLKPVTDYASTTGTSVVLVTGASTSDVVEMIVYDSFAVADTVSAVNGGTFTGNMAMGGTLGVTGITTATGGLNVGTIKDVGNNATAMTIDSSGVITSSAGFANSASANFTAGSTLIAPTTNGIPSWANEIKVAFYNVSTAGTAVTLFRGYASGSVYTTNYEYMAMYAENGGNTTSDRSAGSDGGFSFYPWTDPGNFLSGTVTFTHTTGYEYVAHGQLYIDNQPTYFITLQGRVSFPSAITGIDMYNSTNFDSGQVRVLWR